ncbi:MAG: hypothetical protein AB7H80_08645 [Candidatus Kapaibacterium sp.]
MSDKAEYQKLLQCWMDGGEISSDDQRLLEQLLTSDPEFARLHQQLLRVEESMQVSRASLLSSGSGDRLRTTVETLSRSIPSPVSTGGGVVAKIIGSAVILIVAVTGVLLFIEQNNEPTPQQVAPAQSGLQEQSSLETDGYPYRPIDSLAVQSEGLDPAVESRREVVEGAKESATLNRETRSLIEEKNLADTPNKNPEGTSDEHVENPSSQPIQKSNNPLMFGHGFFDTSKIGSNN